MKIRNKKKLGLIKQRIKKSVEGLNKLYISIAIMIMIGVGLVVLSFWVSDANMKNIAIGLGTGAATSSMVTMYIELVNTQIQKKRIIKYKEILFNPLFNATKSVYVQIILNVNEYRIREEKGNYLLLPTDDTQELSEFFNEMKEIDIDSVADEKKKKHLEQFSHVAPIYFKEVIHQYNGFPFESLILDDIITQEEYEKLKHFTLLNEGVKCLSTLNDETLSAKEAYHTRVQLLHCMLLFMNDFIKMFDFIAKKIEYENEWIEQHLDEIYYVEIYSNSDEYLQQEYARAEAEAEYYDNHPELLEEAEESEEDRLYRKINRAIWARDEATIIECFPQIDKNNRRIQSELTWILAKDVMKNKELRRLYYEKYGIKYKMRKEKKRKK